MNNEEVEINHRSRGGSGWKIWRRKREEEGEQEEEVETDSEDGRRREVAGSWGINKGEMEHRRSRRSGKRRCGWIEDYEKTEKGKSRTRGVQGRRHRKNQN